MKKKLTTITFIMFCINIYAQIGINTDGSSPDSKAILDVSSTTKGVLFPRMTTDQRMALATTLGLTVFDTNTNSYWFFNGTSWVNMVGNSTAWSSNGVQTYLNNLAGNVGIGTSTPDVPLMISSAGGTPGIKVKSTNSYPEIELDSKTGDGYLAFSKNGVQTYFIGSQSTGDFVLYQNNNGPAIHVRKGNGFIGLGHTLPEEKLDIKGRLRIRNTSSGTAGVWFSAEGNSTAHTDGAFVGMKDDQNLGFYIAGVWKMAFNNFGNMTIAGTLTEDSDERLKKDIEKLNDPLIAIKSLNGYHYHWKSGDRDPKLQTGLIAQEVEKLMPELVVENSEGTKSVNYSGVIPYLVEAVKTLSQQNEKLEKEIEKLLKRQK